MEDFYQIESMMRNIKENLSNNSATLVNFCDLSKAYWLTRKYCDDSFLQESIERLLRALDEHHITYCHWKSNEHLSEALNGDTDLDVLFEPTERSLLEQVFAECGLKRFRVTPLMQYAAIEDYIGFDQKEAKIWHVHTHYRMTLGEKHLKGYTVTPWGNVILRNRIRQQQVWTSNPSDELVLLYCRIALKLLSR